MSLTKGTPIAVPEGGQHAGLGVTHRMAAIGIQVDTWDEEVWARPAAREEARTLGISAGSIVMVVERSYFAGELVVEVAAIILPAESTKLVYNGPVGGS
ncbi:UTRA domain-containing protein [Nonomuraea sp. NPDC049028]|uniref:UTRA domain-containing protein n=1 Tax=Nonomuraea sp. NPDC049028 TaxID=3364348 RepID=UPI00371F7123